MEEGYRPGRRKISKWYHLRNVDGGWSSLPKGQSRGFMGMFERLSCGSWIQHTQHGSRYQETWVGGRQEDRTGSVTGSGRNVHLCVLLQTRSSAGWDPWVLFQTRELLGIKHMKRQWVSGVLM